MYRYIICIVVGYVFGCFSTGFFVGKCNHIDIRKHGSGNLGTTNALRTLGVKWGIVTLLGDMIKVFLAIACMRLVFANAPCDPMLLTLLTGLGCILGHNYPVWLHFHGGKGIAATGALIICLDYRITLIALFLFVLSVGITRYVSLGSLFICLTVPVGVLIFYRNNPDFIPMLVVSLLLLFLGIVQHRENIVRLCHGTERKLGNKEDRV